MLRELLNKGIEASPTYSEYNLSIDINEFLGAEEALNKILTLPYHTKMSEEDLKITAEKR